MFRVFRDLKSEGYQLERTQLSGERLEAMIMVIAMAYTREPKRATARHSTFYLGLWGLLWAEGLQMGVEDDFTAGSKTRHQRRALRAAELSGRLSSSSVTPSGLKLYHFLLCLRMK